MSRPPDAPETGSRSSSHGFLKLVNVKLHFCDIQDNKLSVIGDDDNFTDSELEIDSKLALCRVAARTVDESTR
jgi:hypothetical protein